MQAYRIHCLTCNAPLKIDDPSLVGQIFNCPKCFSMVMVTPPPDAVAAAGVPSPAANPTPPAAPLPRKAAAASSPLVPALPAAVPVAPPAPVAPPVIAAPPAATFPWRKWSVLGGSGAAGALLVWGVWFFALKPNRPVEISAPPAVAAALVQSAAPRSAEPAAEKPLATVDRRAEVKAVVSTPQPIAAVPANDRDKDKTNIEKERVAPPVNTILPKQATEEQQLARAVKAEARPVEAPLSARTVEAPFANIPVRPARELPPPSAALTARLALPLAGVKMPAAPLRVLLETIGALGAVQIQCDPSAMARTGLTLDDTAAIETKSASLAEVLEEVLKSRGLTFVATGDQVVVTIPEAGEAPRIHVRHVVDDLAPDRTQLEQLAELVRAVVMPGTWQPAGRGTLTLDQGALVVDQGAEVQWQVRQLCEKLRLARGLPLRSQVSAAWLSPRTRPDMVAELVGRKVTIHAARGAPLADLIRPVAARNNVAIEVDELSLARYGIDSRQKVKIYVDDHPLDKTLDQLLPPLGLAWKPTGPGAVLITTPEELRARPLVEVYPVAKAAANRPAGEALARRLMQQIAPGSWQAEGGQGAIVFDSVSRALIVCQPYPVQFQLAAQLAQ